MKDVEPLIGILDMTPKWAEDEEFIRKGNPFGRRLIVFGLLFLVCTAVDIVLLRMCNMNAWSETVRTCIEVFGCCVVLPLFGYAVNLLINFFQFRSAEKRLKSQKKTDE